MGPVVHTVGHGCQRGCLCARRSLLLCNLNHSLKQVNKGLNLNTTFCSLFQKRTGILFIKAKMLNFARTKTAFGSSPNGNRMAPLTVCWFGSNRSSCGSSIRSLSFLSRPRLARSLDNLRHVLPRPLFYMYGRRCKGCNQVLYDSPLQGCAVRGAETTHSLVTWNTRPTVPNIKFKAKKDKTIICNKGIGI